MMRMSATFLLASISVVSVAFSAADESELPADLEKLVTQLHSPNPPKQIEAARALGRSKDRLAAAALNDAVFFHDGLIEQACKEALREIEGPRTTTSDRVANIEMPDHVKALVVDLGSAYPAVRSWAAGQLGALGARATPAIPFLLDALEDDEAECNDDLADAVSRHARSSLSRIGAPAFEPALARLNHERPLARACAAKLLGSLGHRRAVEPLIASLKDQDGRVRSACVEALGRLKDPRAIKPLLMLTAEEISYPATEGVLMALAAMGEDGIEPIIGLLSHENHEVREAAAGQLARVHEPRTVDPLIKALNDEHQFVQSRASPGMSWVREQRGYEPVLAVYKRKETYHPVRATALRNLRGHPQEVEFLIESLANWSPRVQNAAVQRLGQLLPREAFEPLLDCLRNSKYNDVRADVAEVLAKMNDRRAVPPLIDRLQDPTSLTRAAAARALGSFGDPRAISPLIRALDNEGWDTRRDAAIALSKFDDPRVVAPLIKAMGDSSATVRGFVCHALGRVKAPDAIDALVKVLAEDEDRYVRQHAATALGEQGGRRATEALTVALNNGSENVRQAAREALDKLGGLPN